MRTNFETTTAESDALRSVGVAGSLSKREREVVMLISQGLSNQQIAETLFLTINSVKTYVRKAYRRLDVSTRPQAVIWGVRNEQQLAMLARPGCCATCATHAAHLGL